MNQKDLTSQISKVYTETRHSQRSDKDFTVVCILFKNGYLYEDYRVSNEAAFILSEISAKSGNH